MRILKMAIAIFTLAPQLLPAQDLFILAKGGRSTYGSFYFGNLGGGGGDANWKTGPMIGAGIRLRTSDGFALDGMVEYSTHRHNGQDLSNPPLNDPRNTVLEATALGRSSFTIIFPVNVAFLYGLGLSYQSRDEFVRALQPNSVPADRNVTGAFILGLGVEVRTPRRFEFSIEGSLRCRQYVTPVALLGVAYSPWLAP